MHHCDRIEHRDLLRRTSKDPTAAESVSVAQKGQALAKRVKALARRIQDLYPKLNFEELGGRHWANDNIQICVCEDDCLCDVLEELPLGRDPVDDSLLELSAVALPSAFDTLPYGWVGVKNIEEALRVAQANEALEALRVDIGHKSFLYLENRDWATGKRERTRGYDRINAVEQNMRSHLKRYESARWALHRLGVAHDYPQFLPITRADTRAVTAVYNPNKRGDRNAGMSWIWRGSGTVEGEIGDETGPKEDNAYLKEGGFFDCMPSSITHNVSPVSRVRWLRARSRVDRWNEEVTYLASEMTWYVNFMGYREGEAMKRATVGGRMSAFELRQADMWRRYGMQGKVKFGLVPGLAGAKADGADVKKEPSESDVSDEGEAVDGDFEFE